MSSPNKAVNPSDGSRVFIIQRSLAAAGLPGVLGPSGEMEWTYD